MQPDDPQLQEPPVSASLSSPTPTSDVTVAPSIKAVGVSAQRTSEEHQQQEVLPPAPPPQQFYRPIISRRDLVMTFRFSIPDAMAALPMNVFWISARSKLLVASPMKISPND